MKTQHFFYHMTLGEGTHLSCKALLYKRIVIFALLGLCLSLSSLFSANRQFYENYEQIRVSGPSMLETLHSGELTVSYKPYPYKSLRQRDIVIRSSERGFSVIHRIYKRYRAGLWITKGDNNPKEDRELLGAETFRGLVLVDTGSIKRYRNYLEKRNESIPRDVNAYISSRS